ncbi:MAG TPA: phosphoribosylglycinamide formyltransferase [Nitrososphaera sp.]|jgi:phosphoribosylglycinamide formyltransferase-1|nr:phosphoribosylglycinamide formyltransferase [Nitrososphaera sp.]
MNLQAMFKNKLEASYKRHLINLAILISGRGSNMDAILAAIKSGRIRNAKPCIVISNRPGIAGLKIASEKYEVPTKVILSDGLKGWHYDQNVVTVLHEHGVTPESGLVCLAGFMRIISREFVRQYRMRIMNIHPALLPAFPGLHAQKQALDYGVKVSGCTVHFVDEGLDSGPVILQKAVPVIEGDNEESLSARILEQEHELYPEAVRLYCERRIKINGRRVSII